ncbi:hypothetical protein M9980_09270 [Sphingomonas donggukensis]|uniref:HdeD family acid-resistance protein n=1 Tax=Sphingomonas donggukensis TaxID=2949093 RepID=A0ABY4TUC8_9SPHN|nr:hypothetical protein [Sphingomonas donggukensis]URW74764.1 hypothetical protein M9980_09270 [Sphingomonas donggukensis]
MTPTAATALRGHRIRIAAWSVAALLLLTPLVAMQFTTEVVWTPGDFLFAAIMMGTVGLLVELAVHATSDWSYRGGVMIAVAVSFLIVWINLAVGIIGSEDNPANLMFFAVPLIAGAGAVIARFRPLGMYRAMIAAAIGQVATFAIALVAGWAFIGPITLGFTFLWLCAARLFYTAAR